MDDELELGDPVRQEPTVNVKVSLTIRRINGGFVVNVSKTGLDDDGKYAYSSEENFGSDIAAVNRIVSEALA